MLLRLVRQPRGESPPEPHLDVITSTLATFFAYLSTCHDLSLLCLSSCFFALTFRLSLSSRSFGRLALPSLLYHDHLRPTGTFPLSNPSLPPQLLTHRQRSLKATCSSLSAARPKKNSSDALRTHEPKQPSQVKVLSLQYHPPPIPSPHHTQHPSPSSSSPSGSASSVTIPNPPLPTNPASKLGLLDLGGPAPVWSNSFLCCFRLIAWTGSG